MSTYREDIAEMISAQIQVALEREYDRGWQECMKYYWSKREIDMDELESDIRKNDKGKYEYDEYKEPYAGLNKTNSTRLTRG